MWSHFINTCQSFSVCALTECSNCCFTAALMASCTGHRQIHILYNFYEHVFDLWPVTINYPSWQNDTPSMYPHAKLQKGRCKSITTRHVFNFNFVETLQRVDTNKYTICMDTIQLSTLWCFCNNTSKPCLWANTWWEGPETSGAKMDHSTLDSSD